MFPFTIDAMFICKNMVIEISRLMWTLCLGGVNSVTDHQVGFCVFLGGGFLIQMTNSKVIKGGV